MNLSRANRMFIGGRRRNYAAAGTGRLLSSWGTTNSSADYEIKNSVKNLRSRARQLSRDNDYARRFLKLVVSNVVGPQGITMQSKARDPSRRLDSKANEMIESAFKRWGKRDNCSIDGSLSWRDMQRLIIETVARDGEILVRLIKADVNPFGFALQVLEADHLDINYNEPGNRISMGIEYDGYNRPVNYYIYPIHPGDSSRSTETYGPKIRVPADEMIHLFIKDRPSQTRGVPWMHAAMTRLNNLDGYEEAEIIAARVGASQMGIFTSPDGGYPDGDDDDGDVMMEVEPGVFRRAPAGYDLKMFEPTHPAGNFDAFMKRTLMGVASGLGIAYNSLANDLESVNYSSIRSGSIEERDQWRIIQNWFIESFLNPVYSEWLALALLKNQIGLPFSKYEKYNAPQWFPRSWDWVDPLKDTNAAINEIEAKINTRTNILAERGIDFEDVVMQLSEEEEMLKAAGLVMQPVKKNPANESADDEEDDNDDVSNVQK